MKLKPIVAAALVQAALGRPLTRADRKVLAALARWIMDGCPARSDPWANDDTVVLEPA